MIPVVRVTKDVSLQSMYEDVKQIKPPSKDPDNEFISFPPSGSPNPVDTRAFLRSLAENDNDGQRANN